MRRPAQPATQEPKQLLARIVQGAAVGCTQLCVAGLNVHQVVKTLGQGFDTVLSTDPFERGLQRGLVFDGHGWYFAGSGDLGFVWSRAKASHRAAGFYSVD
jgi:hypothetical protein